MRLSQRPDLNAMIEDYRVRRMSVRDIAKQRGCGASALQDLFRSLGITRSRREAARLGCAKRDSSKWANVPRQETGRNVPRTIERTRTDSIHQLALWFVRCKEITGRYPNGAQVDNMIEQLRVWNGGEVKHMPKEVAM